MSQQSVIEGTNTNVLSVLDLKKIYPGFASLVKNKAFELNGLQPKTVFSNQPAAVYKSYTDGGPMFDFILTDGGHTFVCLRNGYPVITTLFSTIDKEEFHYITSCGIVIKIDLVWHEYTCLLRIFTTRYHLYDITNALVNWHMNRVV
jgi:hypothetical protein